MRKTRREKNLKFLSIFLSTIILSQVSFPTIAFALGDGEVQAEFSGFASGGSDMVNLYTGDFNYEVPVMTVPGPNGGYPIVLGYNSNAVGMEAEASWVGLGWTLNAGAINRSVQGVPDDFNGGEDKISYEYDEKEYVSVGMPLDDVTGREFFGFNVPYTGLPSSGIPTFADHLGYYIYYNNQKGIGATISYNSKFTQEVNGIDQATPFGYSVSFDTQNGISYGLNAALLDGVLGLNTQISSRGGASAGVNLNLTATFSDDLGYISGTKEDGNQKLHRLKDFSHKSSVLSGGIQFGSIGSISIPNSPASYITESFDIQIKRPIDSPFNVTLTGINFKQDNFKRWLKMNATVRKLKEKEFEREAFGFIYDGNVTEGIKDYSRQEFPNVKGSKHLSVGSPTTDLFSQSGYGSGSAFKFKKSDIQKYSTSSSTNEIKEHVGTFDLGLTQGITHLGLGYGKVVGEERSGDWKSNDNIQLQKSSKIEVQEVYVSPHGTVEPLNNVLSVWGGDEAITPKVEKSGFGMNRKYSVKALYGTNQNEFFSTEVVNTGDQRYNGRQTREKRNKSYQCLTRSEASAFGYTKEQYISEHDIIGTDLDKRNANHISEINVIESGGLRYTYATPVYQDKKVEATFSVDINDEDEMDVTNNRLEDVRSSENPQKVDIGKKGQKILKKSTLSPHAVSWLLNEIVSEDYKDIDNIPGPSEGDLGYWVKFGYEKMADNYAWRYPLKGAILNKGIRGLDYDNTASYSYGEREQYYLNQIETKTHIAKFEYDDRKDCLGAVKESVNINGGKDVNVRKKRLYRISLYVKDLTTEDPNDVYETPVKVANFVHDYSLCKNVDNQFEDGLGKLTLKEIYFTYGNSNRGERERYLFEYDIAEEGFVHNPDYNYQNVDRWGNFKTVVDKNGEYVYSSNYPYEDFKYVENQEVYDVENGMNLYVADAPWRLKRIITPSGSELNVEYEQGDYAYVEDQEAMQMLDIKGVDGFNNSGVLKELKLGLGISNRTDDISDVDMVNHNVIYFEVPINTTAADIKQKYVPKSNSVYMNASVYLKDRDPLQSYWSSYENVEVQAEVDTDKCGVILNEGKTYGYITLKKVPLKENSMVMVNPIRKSSFEALKQRRQDLLYGQPQSVISPMTLLNFAQDLTNILGQTNSFLAEGYCSFMRLNGYSKIRLKQPDKKRKGGNYRVKSIKLSDNWVNSSENDGYEYIQEYIYETEESGEVISSGVAYEPIYNAEENPMYNLDYFIQKIPFGENNRMYYPGNIMSSFYPSGSLGYSKVTVKNVYPEDTEHTFEKSSVPITTTEFFTPKDFPIVTDHTLASWQKPASFNLNVTGYLNLSNQDGARAEGHSIIKNDMAGKLKRVRQFTRGGKQISRQEYFYKKWDDPTDALFGNDKGILSNVGYVLDRNETGEIGIRKARIGYSYDVYLDYSENGIRQEGTSGLEGNLSLSPALPFLNYLTFPSFAITDIQQSTKTVVVNKVIERHGLLEKVEIEKNESTVTTEYLAYDAETGSPLLTKIHNEFGDAIYNFSRPAHWEYKNMGMSYQNQDLVFSDFDGVLQTDYMKLGTGHVARNYFTEGDIVAYKTTGSNYLSILAAITEVSDETGDQWVKLESFNGSTITNASAVRVIRSGYTNQQFSNVGGVSALKLVNANGEEKTFSELANESNATLNFDEVLNVSAVTYKDDWELFCCVLNNPKTSPNAYFNGSKGIWRAHESFAYHADRDYTPQQNSQKDGLLTGPVEFNWQDPSLNSYQWVKTGELISISPDGNAIEQKDALGKSSSSLYGYGGNMVKAVAGNAGYDEMGYDGFEDYGLNDCNTETHFSFKVAEGNVELNETHSHTGKTSLKISPNSEIKLKRKVVVCETE